MTILLVLGVVLVVFGGLVLLLFPDRPGGKVGWQGFEVSSVGAGLPVIVVGVVAVGFAALHGNSLGLGSRPARAGSTNPGSQIAGGCLGSVFQGVPASRRMPLPFGSTSVAVPQPPDQPVKGRIALRLTDLGRTVGGVVFSYSQAADVFTIFHFVDADCTPAHPIDITTASQSPEAPKGWDYLQVRLGGKLYNFRLGYQPPIEADFIGASS